MMETRLIASRYEVRGLSLGGMYTALSVPALDCLLDVGIALRSGCAANHLFLSHGHIDHVGALPALLGMRGLCGVTRPLKIYAPTVLAQELPAFIEAAGRLHRWPFAVEIIAMEPGQAVELRRDLSVRAFRTHHPVPSLGYLFFRTVQKLLPEYQQLPGPELARLRKDGAPIFETQEHGELAYATDTLPELLRHQPELAQVRVLVLECTFLDSRKPLEAARAGGHIHLDELLPHLPALQNEALVLMHFSQLYSPADVRTLLAARCTAGPTVLPLVPDGDRWWL